MKTYMPLNGLRWSRNSGSANCDMPQSAVFGRPGGGGDVESLGQFGIHHHLLSRIEVLHKLAFHALGGISVGEDIIHDALPALVGFVHRGVLLLSENVAGVFAI